MPWEPVCLVSCDHSSEMLSVSDWDHFQQLCSVVTKKEISGLFVFLQLCNSFFCHLEPVILECFLNLLKPATLAIKYCQCELFYFALGILGEKTHLKLN